MKAQCIVANKIREYWKDSWIYISLPALGLLYVVTYILRVYLKIPLSDNMSTFLWGFYLLYVYAKWQGLKDKKKK